MGSSAISPIFVGKTGPTGAKGLIGSIGPTGSGSGLTGITGPTGVYIYNSAPANSDTVLIKSDNSVPFILENTRGPTGYTGTMFGVNLGSGLTLYSGINGFTLSLRGLTFIGNLSAAISQDGILVTPTDVYYGTTLSSSIANNRVVYSKSSTIVDSSRIQLGTAHNNFIFSQSAGITSGSLPVYSEIQGNLIDVPSGSSNLILGLTSGSVYFLHTPLGLSGFTLDSSLYGDKEIISFTFFVEGNGFTQFPPNVYFENTPYSSVFGCGVNIMNIMTYDKGQNWFATITDRGYGVQRCPGEEGVGSCCYIGPSGDRECVEYVTKDWCDGKSGGNFGLLTPCSPTCRETAACCSNGVCVEGVSKQECEYFLGKYYKGISCAAYPSKGDNTQRLCYDVTGITLSCCTGGTCIDRVTAAICQDYYKGTSIVGSCCEISCETLGPIQGACCVRDETPQCSIKTPSECAAASGVFYGNGTVCDDVNCCFESEQLGSCCVGADCQANRTRSQCDGLFGTWYPTQDSCLTACSAGSKVWCCLLPGLCEANYTPEGCLSFGGTPYTQPDCGGLCI